MKLNDFWKDASFRKCLRIMKLMLYLLVASVVQVYATNVAAQKVNYSGQNVSLKEVLSVVEKQTGYMFFYDETLLDKANAVTVHFSGEAVNQVMDEICATQNLSWSVENQTITLFLKSKPVLPDKIGPDQAAFPQQTTITGKIISKEGMPIPGASIIVKGTKRGISSDSNGYYSLKIEKTDNILVFSSVGFKPIEVLIDNRDVIDVTLEEANIVLSDNVVFSTGYQKIPRERSAGSFTKPNPTIIQDRSSSPNLLQRLEGTVPGFIVNLAQGSAPSGSNRILTGEGNSNQYIIRGIGSVQADRAPLCVVNGIIIDDLGSLNANDVETITVLKDATASSIWGARAANGVIVITTKKGALNEKIKVQYDVSYNMQGKPDYNYWPRLSSADFIKTAREIFDPVVNTWANASTFTSATSMSIVAPHERILYDQYRGVISAAQANARLDSLSKISNSKQIGDLFYRNKSLMNQTISINGGSKSYSFYGSFSDVNDQSSVPGEKNNKYFVNLRQDLTLGNRINIFLITDLTNNVSGNKRTISVDNRFLPYQLFQDENGKSLDLSYLSFITTPELKTTFQNQSKINLDYNPVDEFNRGETNSNTILGRVTAGGSIKIFDGLKFEGTYGYSKGSTLTTMFDDETSFPVRSLLVQFTQAAVAPSTLPTYYFPNTGGQLNTANSAQSGWTVRNLLDYDASFKGRKHQITLLLGQEAQESSYSSSNSTVYGYDPLLMTYQNVDFKNLATNGVSSPVAAHNTSNRSLFSNQVYSESWSLTRVSSYFATGGYTYNSKYTINGSWRSDQSNLFGIDKSVQRRPVWSVGAKWQIGKEDFIKQNNRISNLDLRLTYGITGNAPRPGSATSYDVMTSSVSSFAPGPGLSISTYANRGLGWERTENINIGIDYGFFKNRLSGSIDVYKRRTTDLIGQLPTNLLSGPSSVTGNFGDMYNKGVELSLNSINISTRDFTWSTTLNMSYNVNKITKLVLPTAVSDLSRLVQQTKYYEGYPALSIFAYNWAGLDNMGDPQIYLPDGTKYKAALVTGLSVDGAKYMGTFQPVWNGGFLNFIRYKNFSLSSSIIFNLGYYGRRDAMQQLSGGRLDPLQVTFSQGSYPELTSGNVSTEILNRWKQPGDENITDVPSYITTNTSRRNTAYYFYGSNNVYDASYIKMRDISLSYRMPKSFLEKLKVDEIQLRVQFSNVMLWKANKFGLDPEFQISDINYTLDRKMPVGQGAITIGLNVKF